MFVNLYFKGFNEIVGKMAHIYFTWIHIPGHGMHVHQTTGLQETCSSAKQWFFCEQQCFRK